VANSHLVAVVLRRKRLKRRLDDATTQTEHQVQRRLLLDIVVGKRAAIFELLASEDQSLLVWGDALFVLDLGFDIVCFLLSVPPSKFGFDVCHALARGSRWMLGNMEVVGGVPMVSEDSTSRVMVLPVTARSQYFVMFVIAV